MTIPWKTIPLFSDYFKSVFFFLFNFKEKWIYSSCLHWPKQGVVWYNLEVEWDELDLYTRSSMRHRNDSFGQGGMNNRPVVTRWMPNWPSTAARCPSLALEGASIYRLVMALHSSVVGRPPVLAPAHSSSLLLARPISRSSHGGKIGFVHIGWRHWQGSTWWW